MITSRFKFLYFVHTPTNRHVCEPVIVTVITDSVKGSWPFFTIYLFSAVHYYKPFFYKNNFGPTAQLLQLHH